ncbi:unnamed protein product [Closterium sp. Yama58-4]|nr:unnamed protein product [Closterium sp. Yama58-4]
MGSWAIISYPSPCRPLASSKLAAADKYGVKINLITSYPGDQFLIEIFPCQGKPTRELWLSFWAEVHYNSVYSAESLPPPQPKKKHWLFA